MCILNPGQDAKLKIALLQKFIFVYTALHVAEFSDWFKSSSSVLK